jgi:hypothetical protein
VYRDQLSGHGSCSPGAWYLGSPVAQHLRRDVDM